MSNTIARTLAGLAIAGTMAGAAFAGTAAAQADAIPDVCTGIDAEPTYRAYIIDADIYGRLHGYNSHQQAQNIIDSVAVYCPWHMAGIRIAAASLS